MYEIPRASTEDGLGALSLGALGWLWRGLANVLAIGLGVLVIGVFQLSFQPGFLMLVLAATFGALAVGLIQHQLIWRPLKTLPLPWWLLATVTGWDISILFFLMVAIAALDGAGRQVVTLGLAFALLFGALPALLQGMLLRGRLRLAWLWVPLNMLAPAALWLAVDAIFTI